MLLTNSERLNSEMCQFEDYLLGLFANNDKLSGQATRELVDAGGKRLRPMFTLLFSGVTSKAGMPERLAAAAAIELLHTATLVHDDIIDEANKRRGKETINSKYGVHMAVYVGDYLLMKSAQQFLNIDGEKQDTMGIIKTLTDVLDGEIQQYLSIGKMISVFAYLRKTRKKTANVFGMACSLGAHCAGLSQREKENAMRFGNCFGMAFQIRDDIINMLPQNIEKKDLFSDIKNGIITLPVILAVKDKSGDELAGGYLENMIKSGALLDMCNSHSITASKDVMMKYLERAETSLASFNNEEMRSVFLGIKDRLCMF